MYKRKKTITNSQKRSFMAWLRAWYNKARWKVNVYRKKKPNSKLSISSFSHLKSKYWIKRYTNSFIKKRTNLDKLVMRNRSKKRKLEIIWSSWPNRRNVKYKTIKGKKVVIPFTGIQVWNSFRGKKSNVVFDIRSWEINASMDWYYQPFSASKYQKSKSYRQSFHKKTDQIKDQFFWWI